MKNTFMPLLLSVLFTIPMLACDVEQRCYENKDCPLPQICTKLGVCDYVCRADRDCGQNFVCENNLCTISKEPEPECVTKEDCDKGQLCDDGQCVVDPLACSSKDDCDRDYECKDGRCVMRENPESCVKDDECLSAYECKDSRCVMRENPESCLEDDECIDGYLCEDKRCVVDPLACVTKEDCDAGYLCEDKRCVVDPLACVSKEDCDEGYECKDGRCTYVPKFVCPEGMAKISNTYCIDRFEASRPDATDAFAGADESMATSRPNVMPWLVGADNAKATEACENAGKRLCTPSEWEFACRGDKDTNYAYGDEYDIYICNGLDTHGYWKFHLLPTQSLPDCHNGWGVYDMNGNVWEHTADGSGMTVRGGAFNCADSKTNHRCDYIPSYWTPSALGFRCCADIEREKSPTPKKRIMTSHMPPIEKPKASDALAKAEKLWKAKSYQEALDFLKEAQKTFPDNDDIVRALGISYLNIENYPWAIRSFRTILNRNPNDCSTEVWLAWTYLQMANLDEIPELLENPNCQDQNLFARQRLLSAYVAMTEDENEKAKQDLDQVYQEHELSESDAEALKHMRQQMGMSAPPSMTWSLEASGGYASNALSGSPHDPKLVDKSKGSALAELDLRLALDPMSYAFVRPKGEVRARGQWLFSKDARDASYLDLSARLGIAAEWPDFVFSAFYRPDFLVLKGGDAYDNGPLLFYQGHRLELDFEIANWLYLFAGYGQRQFRQAVRTRSEFDLALGAHHRLVSTLALIWSVGYRHWDTKQGLYDLNGFNLSLVLDYRVPKYDLRFRINGAYSLDDYPYSEGYFDEEQKRRDHALRGTVQAWSPSWGGVRIGVVARASRRFSSAATYSFQDYRAQLSLKYTGEVDFYAPSRRSDDGFELPWAFEQQENSERIRDLIQQDEDIQGASSCLQN